MTAGVYRYHLNEEAMAYAKGLIECKARQLVGQARLNASDVDDLKQDMWADLLRRLSWFESDRAKVKTFIARILSHRVSAILQYRSGMSRDYRRDEGSLSEFTTDADGQIVERAQMIPEDVHDLRTGADTRSALDQMEMTNDIEAVLASLPAPLRELCHLLKTESMSAAARKLGISRRAARTRLAAIRKHFEKADLRDYL